MEKIQKESKQLQKRYQYYGPNGIQWTDWFPYHGEDYPTKQQGNKLKIEYKDESIGIFMG